MRLHISHDMKAEIYGQVGAWNFVELTTFSKGLRKLSILPLLSVEVYVINPKYLSNNGLWTKCNREEIANGLENLLLHSRGAEIYAEARQKELEAHRREREGFASIRRPLPFIKDSTS